jgi:hypothetical protein
MRHLASLAVAVALGISLSPVVTRGQGNDIAFHFRVTDAGTAAGETVNGVSTGRAVASKGRVRIDMKGNSRAMAMPGMAPSDEVSMIMLDNGKTILYLQPKTKQYMRFDPVEAVDGMQKMIAGMGGEMSFDITGDGPKLENLGAGPVILGYHTVHYRLTTGLKMTMSMMGESQEMEMSSTTDEYLAPDLGSIADPFRGMTSSGMSGMSGMFGSGNKSYLEKIQAAFAKLPKATALRAETTVTVNGAGQQSHLKTTREVTGIEKITVSPHLFEVPAGYTKVQFPMGMNGPGIPPEQH